ncbi:type II toxin-antitoxin system HicA family toxin [Leptolyngbya sp. AN03gr2]|uniref:type II toxin-antitoxin system HicA family toxin n=1 Tax=unclassified Leptolyngbya TaxID=2650499 RepID=UPI003D31724B
MRQKGSHARWKHPDGRATTIPIHGKSEIGAGYFMKSWISLELQKKNLRNCARKSFSTIWLRFLISAKKPCPDCHG